VGAMRETVCAGVCVCEREREIRRVVIKA
jgi:hypothetical protein